MRRRSISNDGMTIRNATSRNATANSSKTFRMSATSVGTLFIYTLALEKYKIPDDIDYSKFENISAETRDKLQKIRPKTLAQASRIGGVKPVDISVLMVMLDRHTIKKQINQGLIF